MGTEATFALYGGIGVFSLVAHVIAAAIAFRIIARKNREQQVALEAVRKSDEERRRRAAP